MDKKDIDKFLKAKRREHMRKIVTLAAIGIICCYTVLRLMGIDFPYIIFLT